MHQMLVHQMRRFNGFARRGFVARACLDTVIERLKQKAKRENTSLEQAAREALAAAAAPRREDLIAFAAAMRERTAARKPHFDVVAAIRYDRDHGREWL